MRSFVFIVFRGKLSSIFNWAYNLLGGSICLKYILQFRGASVVEIAAFTLVIWVLHICMRRIGCHPIFWQNSLSGFWKRSCWNFSSAMWLLICTWELFILTYLDDIMLILHQNRLWWYGHVLRKEDMDWVKKCMEYEVDGSRPRGRQKRMWWEVVQQVDQRGHGQRLCKKIAKHAIWTRRMLSIVVDGRSW